MWVFRRERDTYWVGYLIIVLSGAQKFEPMIKCESREDAMTKCHYLNGGN